MTSATAVATGNPRLKFDPRPAANLRRPRLRTDLLLEICVCSIPAMGLVALGYFAYSTAAFFGTLCLLLTYHALKRDAAHCTALILSLMPLILMQRVFFFQNTPTIILAGCLGLWGLFATERLLSTVHRLLPFAFVSLSFLYWWVSFISTYRYSTNLRVFELAFSALAVLLLARHRSLLITMVLGQGLSVLLMIFGLLPYMTERVGLAEIGESGLGHPGQVALPALIVMILCLVDKGDWILPGAALHWRLLIAASAAVLIIVTTSRTTWVLGLIAIGMAAVLDPKRNLKVLAWATPALLVAVLVVFIALPVSQIEVIEKYFMKATSSERTLTQKTSGRFLQYLDFPELFAESPVWGHGPGSARRFHSTKGVVLTMHSAYLHIGVETGMIGLSAYLLLLGGSLVQAFRFRALTGQSGPIIILVCLAVDGLAHNSFNATLGLMLGLGWTAGELSTIWRERRVGVPRQLRYSYYPSRRMIAEA